MARTTAGNVRLLSGDFTDMTDPQMEPHILAAFTIVNDNVAADSAATSVKLELIERFIAAHFATVFVREATNEKAGTVGATYEGNAAKGQRLDSTRFGRNAILLDDTGSLAYLNSLSMKKQTTSLKAMNKTPSTW